MSETKVNSSFLSKLKETVTNKGGNLPDITGRTLGEFHVDRRMNLSSGEADIYRCSGTGSHVGEGFVLKYYRRENAVKQEVLEKISSIKSPCVAPVTGYGEYEGHQYAVRPYYEMPVLSEVLASGNTFSKEELKTLIIPSVITGLKAIHDVGILHKDLKPANLIPDNAGEHVVLIDFGISSDAGKNTFVVTQTGMTPFYAAPEAMQGIFHKETDYYALGITVFELFTGFTPFQNPGLSPEEAARLASVSKIEFPESFPEDLKKLVLGLTYKDISHRNEPDNPNRRWGYDEVRRWLNGEDVTVPGDPPTTKIVLPYTFGTSKLLTTSDLVRALLKKPEQGIKELARGKLTQHFGYFDAECEDLCKRAETELGSSENEHYLAFFRLMYQLSGNERSLFCGGKEFAGLAELAFAATDKAVAVAEDVCVLDIEEVSQFLKEVTMMFRSGALEYYAAEVANNNNAGELFRKLNKLHGEHFKEYSLVQQALVFGYGFSENRKLAVLGVPYSSPKVFADRMASDRKKNRHAHEQRLLESREELEFLIAALPDTASRDCIQLVYDDARSAIFGDFEFQFKDENDFNEFVEQSIRKGNIYVVRSLLHRYGAPLEEISGSRYWKSDTCKRLKKIVDTMIPMGEYLFADEKSFARFVHDMEKEGRQKPLFLRDFALVHEPYLQELADSDNPRISELAGSLLKHKNDVEMPGCIRIWGKLYPKLCPRLSSCYDGRGYGPGRGYGLNLITEYD